MSRWFLTMPRCLAAAAALAGGGRAAVQAPVEVIVPTAVTAPGEVLVPVPADAAAPGMPVPPAVVPAPGGCPACGGTGCDVCKGFDFKTVPPAIHPAVRPGMFPIPPSGKGYYSVYDRLTGQSRDAAPKYPYPPFTTSTLSFFDADWKFVDDPKYTPDALEKLKRIHVGDDWLLSTGGQAWFRSVGEYNSRLTQTDNTFTLYRVRPYLDVWYQDKFRFFIEGIFADSAFHDLPPLGNDVNRADFQNLFIDVKVAEYEGKPVYVRVGRQEMQFGSQRLIGTPDWANTRRSFQGVRGFRAGDKWDVDLFWVQPIAPNPTKLDSGDNNQNFAGAWATYRPKKGTALDMYYLFLDNTNRVTQQGIAKAPATLHTIGGRYAGDVDNRFLWDVEGAVQLGQRGDENVAAGMFTAGVGYHFKDLPWNPTLWGYYDYASGDHNPNNGTYTTFNQLFPFGHYYFGWIDVVGRQNIHDLNGSLHLYPAKWLTMWTQYHIFALDQSRDALYNAAGTAVRRDPTGKAGNYVGTELDFIFNFHLSKRADLLTGYSYLFGGEFLKNTAGRTQGKDTSLVYLSYSYRW